LAKVPEVSGSKEYGLTRLRETMVVSEAISRSMRGNGAVETSPEVTLRKALWKSGIRGYRKNDRRIFGRPDLYFARAQLCVFVHGCFWHGCPRCATTRNLVPKLNGQYWKEKIQRNQARDEEVVATLQSEGWCVEVFWECDIKKDLPSVVDAIKEAVKSRHV
jgi:DNA mismatch endonuclease (patch repair protein)